MSQTLMLQKMAIMHGDFKVAVANGDYWSKHKSVMGCWESEDFGFLSEANNRQIFPCEIVLDIDEGDIQKKRDDICAYLNRFNVRYQVWESGGKGVHVHVLVPYWALLGQIQKEKFRTRLITKFGCDPIKKSQNVMIALENSPHRKTGRLKTLIAQRGVWF